MMINPSRLTFIKELESFIENKQKVLSSVLNTLGWTEESMKSEVQVCCPVNPDHWMPESALSHHKEICQLVKEGYTREELEKQPPDSTFFYEKTSNVIPIVLDQPTIEKALFESNLNVGNTSKEFPKTVDRFCIQFTPEQRLAIYDFIIRESKVVEKPKNVTLEDLMIDFEKKEEQDEKPKSQLEILAEMRDYKRRRQSYRAKNVHITKKSYTEIMREVIENQTNYLMETEKYKDPKNKHEDSIDNKRKYMYDSDNYESFGDASPKHRDNHSRHRRDDYESNHHSKHKSSKHHSPKRKKHKRDRSRSRSPSRHKHKKSHKKKSHHD